MKLEKQIANYDLLIIDDVSTNLPLSEWLTIFENQTMVAAMIDRLTYRSFVLNMNSGSPYRAKFAAQSHGTADD